MFKRFMKMATTSMLSMMLLSSFLDFTNGGPCVFLFGEPEFPTELR